MSISSKASGALPAAKTASEADATQLRRRRRYGSLFARPATQNAAAAVGTGETRSATLPGGSNCTVHDRLGFTNTGNTCHLASTLQGLFAYDECVQRLTHAVCTPACSDPCVWRTLSSSATCAHTASAVSATLDIWEPLFTKWECTQSSTLTPSIACCILSSTGTST